MTSNPGVKEAARIKRELRRIRTQVPPEYRWLVAALERLCDTLSKRLEGANSERKPSIGTIGVREATGIKRPFWRR